MSCFPNSCLLNHDCPNTGARPIVRNAFILSYIRYSRRMGISCSQFKLSLYQFFSYSVLYLTLHAFSNFNCSFVQDFLFLLLSSFLKIIHIIETDLMCSLSCDLHVRNASRWKNPSVFQRRYFLGWWWMVRVIVILLAQDPIKTSGMGNASSWASRNSYTWTDLPGRERNWLHPVEDCNSHSLWISVL